MNFYSSISTRGRALARIGGLLAMSIGMSCAADAADNSQRAQMKGLDEQVQEIKSDVLSIAAELNRLEEKLLYPSNTQLAVFVTIEKGNAARLDAIQIQIDGQPAAHYIYSFKELDALRRGGVQRVYTGNVPTGTHQLEVAVTGKLESGKEFTEAGRFTVTKGIEPKLVGVTLTGNGSGSTAIQLGDW